MREDVDPFVSCGFIKLLLLSLSDIPESMVIIRWILLPALSLLLFFSVHILYGGCNFSGDWDEVLTGTDLPMSFSKKVKSLQENWMDDGDWTSCG